MSHALYRLLQEEEEARLREQNRPKSFEEMQAIARKEAEEKRRLVMVENRRRSLVAMGLEDPMPELEGKELIKEKDDFEEWQDGGYRREMRQQEILDKMAGKIKEVRNVFVNNDWRHS